MAEVVQTAQMALMLLVAGAGIHCCDRSRVHSWDMEDFSLLESPSAVYSVKSEMWLHLV